MKIRESGSFEMTKFLKKNELINIILPKNSSLTQKAKLTNTLTPMFADLEGKALPPVTCLSTSVFVNLAFCVRELFFGRIMLINSFLF